MQRLRAALVMLRQPKAKAVKAWMLIPSSRAVDIAARLGIAATDSQLTIQTVGPGHAPTLWGGRTLRDIMECV